ncbi:MAG: hypothetical protein Q9187_001388, partial [Circinaria calcarea]
MEPTDESQQHQSRFMNAWLTIPDFKRTLMSMLTPAELLVFLASIGYIMTDAEKTRFMRFDRHIFKDTTALEKLMKEGYDVTLVSTRLHQLRDLMKNKEGLDHPFSINNVDDRQIPRWPYRDEPSHEDPNRRGVANVWLIITHRDHLAKDKINRTVIRHPEFRWHGWYDGPGKPGE